MLKNLLLVADRGTTKLQTQCTLFCSQDDPDRTASVLHDNLYWTGKCHKWDTVKYQERNYRTSDPSFNIVYVLQRRKMTRVSEFIPGQ